MKEERKKREDKGKKRWFQKASLTVEAAIALPVFFVAILILLELIDVYRIHGMIELSLQESARSLSVAGYLAGDREKDSLQLPAVAACTAYARSQLPDQVTEYAQISLADSRIEGDTLELRAIYWPKIGNQLLPVRRFSLLASARVHFFNGYSGDGHGDTGSETGSQMVYVTDYESVYHTDGACSHIQLTIRETTAAGAEAMRNQDGERYSPCERCIGNGLVEKEVYVSERGNRYHNSFACSGLKRSVRLIERSEAEGLQECSRCKKGKG